MFQSLQAECEKAQSQLSQLQKKLVESDRCCARHEEKLSDLTAENSKLSLDLVATKQRGQRSCMRQVGLCGFEV